MLKLIIADDEFAIREAISSIIDWKALNIDLIGKCKNGPETLKMIYDSHPDIVLTDIKMPGLSGLDLIKQTVKCGMDISFIILSGYAEFEYAKQAIQFGVSNYLLKPCNENQITEAIKKASAEIMKKKKIRELIPESLIDNSQKRGNFKDCITQMLDYIDSHFSQPDLTLKKISSEILYMNEDYLSKEFFRQTGKKFTEYVTELRITKAKVLLSQNSPCSINQVAEEVGFSNNPQYFSHLFKNVTGTTPREYHKLCRNHDK